MNVERVYIKAYYILLLFNQSSIKKKTKTLNATRKETIFENLATNVVEVASETIKHIVYSKSRNNRFT